MREKIQLPMGQLFSFFGDAKPEVCDFNFDPSLLRPRPELEVEFAENAELLRVAQTILESVSSYEGCVTFIGEVHAQTDLHTHEPSCPTALERQA
jgi:hypothetical protein